MKYWVILVGGWLLQSPMADAVDRTGVRTDSPKNVLRERCGAHWMASGRKDLPSLSDDPSAWFPLPSGSWSETLDLGSFRVVDRVTLQQSGLSGHLKIEIRESMQSGDWVLLGAGALKARTRGVEVNLLPLPGRYLKLSIATSTAGKIRALGAFGPQAMDAEDANELWQKEDPKSAQWQQLDISYLSLGTELQALAQGATALGMAHDDDVATSVVFSPGAGQKAPSFTVDLGVPVQLERIVILHTPTEGGWWVEPLDDNELSSSAKNGVGPGLSSAKNGREFGVPSAKNGMEPSAIWKAEDGATVADGLGLPVRRLRLTWKGEEPFLEPFEVFELALFARPQSKAFSHGRLNHGAAGGGPGAPAVGAVLEDPKFPGAPDIEPASK